MRCSREAPAKDLCGNFRGRAKTTWSSCAYCSAAAAKSLGEIGTDGVASLIKGLASKDAWVRTTSARALGRVKPVAAEVVDPLIKVLTDTDERVRREVAIALGRIGPKANAAADALKKAAKEDKDYIVAHAAVESLRRLAE